MGRDSVQLPWGWLLLVMIVVLSVSGAPAAADQEFGASEVFATFPAQPGFPEGIAVRDGLVYVAGPAAPGTAGNGIPSAVVAYDVASGALVQTYNTQGEDLEAEHANTCIAFDDSSRLYVLNSQLGVYRLNTETGVQDDYASALPDIGACLFAKDGTDCSPGLRNRPPLTNDIAFDAAGNAYITDSLQATIWKVPAGGGAPEVWFQSFRLSAYILGFIGVNGLRIDPSGTEVYISVTTDPLNRGVVYILPLGDRPDVSDLAEFHVFDRGDTPDGLAFGASGRLYAVINGDAPKIIVLNPDGSEHSRITSPYFYSPANAAFDGSGSLLVVNHPISEGRKDPSLFMIVKVYVDDIAHPLITPTIP